MNEIVRPTIDLTLDVRIPKMEPIEHNLGNVKEAITKLNEFYDSLIFTEDQVSDAEKELTKLRGLLKTIEDNRKETVKEFKKPIDDFEGTSKDIEKLLKASVEIIKSKIEGFKQEEENKKIEEIKGYIHEVYESFIIENPQYKEDILEEQILYNEKWFNKTFKLSQMKEEIAQQFIDKRNWLENYNKDINTIKEFVELNNKELNLEKYITEYKYTQNLTNVLDKIKEDAKNLVTVTGNVKVFNESVDLDNVSDIPDPFAQFDTNKTIKITGTAEQINALKVYAYTLGITNIEEVK